MTFDLRLAVGLLFTILGLLLAAFGLVTPAGMYQKSLGINVNLVWGLAILAFGALMLIVALRARIRATKSPGR